MYSSIVRLAIFIILLVILILVFKGIQTPTNMYLMYGHYHVHSSQTYQIDTTREYLKFITNAVVIHEYDNAF